MPRKKKLRGRELHYKKRLLSRKAKRHKTTIVSRKGQPIVYTEVVTLKPQDIPIQSISSSWLSAFGYILRRRIAFFKTKTGRSYNILDFPWEQMQQWYYAHSKGTYFNRYIRNKFKIVPTL